MNSVLLLVLVPGALASIGWCDTIRWGWNATVPVLVVLLPEFVDRYCYAADHDDAKAQCHALLENIVGFLRERHPDLDIAAQCSIAYELATQAESRLLLEPVRLAIPRTRLVVVPPRCWGLNTTCLLTGDVQPDGRILRLRCVTPQCRIAGPCVEPVARSGWRILQPFLREDDMDRPTRCLAGQRYELLRTSDPWPGCE